MLKLYAASLLLERNLKNRYAIRHVVNYVETEGDKESAMEEMLNRDLGKWSIRDIDIIDLTNLAKYITGINESLSSEPPEPPKVELSDPLPIGFYDGSGEIWTLADRVAFRDLNKRIASIEMALKGRI